jgi:predicted nucleic acid-binding protein
MNVVFDTNVYISFIRDLSHSAELLQRGTTKYLSAVVLMELWAGAKTRAGKRIVERLQKPYAGANRIITLRPSQYILIGQFLGELPRGYTELRKKAAFVNDVQIGFTALYLGAELLTEDEQHFEIIRKRIPALQVRFLAA